MDHTTPPPAFQVRLFGSFDLRDRAGCQPHFYSDKVRALLVYLIANPGEPIPRGELAALLWPRFMHASARTNLRKALHELRRTLGNIPSLRGNRRAIWIAREPEGLCCDLWEVWDLLERVDQHPHASIDACSHCQRHLTALHALVETGFCPGLELGTPEGFDPWRQGMESRLKERFGAIVRAHRKRQVHLNLGNLSLNEGAFYGRDSLLRGLEAALAKAPSRCLFLVGMGGVGKSRLARELARRMAPRFEDGVWLVPLSPRRGRSGEGEGLSTSGLPERVAQAMGLVSAQKEGPVLERLRYGRSLLILDEFEHRLGEAGAVEAALAELRHVVGVMSAACFIVTSRLEPPTPFGITHRLGGLSFPDARDRALSTLEASPSVALFAQARSARLDLPEMTPPELRLAGEITQALEGHPLGVKLAGALSQSMPLESLRGRMAETPGSLPSPYRDAPPRQRSLSTLLHSAFDPLTPSERLLLAALTFFRGDFHPRDILPLMTSALQLSSTQSGCERLVRQCLLEPKGDGRLGMHPIVRQAVEAQRRAWGEALNWPGSLWDTFLEAFSRHFLGKLKGQRDALVRAEDEALRALGPMGGEVLFALEIAETRGDLHLAVDVAIDLVLYGAEVGILQEVVHRLGGLRAQMDQVVEEGRSPLSSRLELALGFGYGELWRTVESLNHLARVHATDLDLDEQRLHRVLQGIYGTLAGGGAEDLARLESLNRPLAGGSALGLYVRLRALRHRGMWSARLGEPGADALMAELLRLARLHHVRRMELQALLDRAGLYVVQGQGEAARLVLEEGLELLHSYGLFAMEGSYLHGLAYVVGELGDVELSRSLYSDSLDQARRQGFPSLVMKNHLGLGYAYLQLGALGEARSQLEMALGMHTMADSPIERCRAMLTHALILNRLGEPHVRDRVNEARRIAAELDYWPSLCEADTLLLELALEDEDEASIGRGVEALTHWIDAHPGLPSCSRLRVYYVCYLGMEALGEEGLAKHRSAMIERLETELEAISTPEARRRFIEGSEEAQAIYAIAETFGGA